MVPRTPGGVSALGNAGQASLHGSGTLVGMHGTRMSPKLRDTDTSQGSPQAPCAHPDGSARGVRAGAWGEAGGGWPKGPGAALTWGCCDSSTRRTGRRWRGRRPPRARAEVAAVAAAAAAGAARAPWPRSGRSALRPPPARVSASSAATERAERTARLEISAAPPPRARERATLGAEKPADGGARRRESPARTRPRADSRAPGRSQLWPLSHPSAGSVAGAPSRRTQSREAGRGAPASAEPRLGQTRLAAGCGIPRVPPQP